MFDKDELAVFVRHGQMLADVAAILAVCEDGEPELMQAWVYRKRIKPTPAAVEGNHGKRMFQLADKAGVKHLSKFTMQNVCNAIWDRLPEDERQRLMRSI